MRKLLAIGAIGAVGVLTAALGGPAGAQSSGTGTVTVIHGVPDLPVDVYVNDEPTLTDFAPETVTDPLELPAGDYQIDIRAAGEPADAEPAISGSATLPAGANASIIAHLNEAGEPTLSVFVNDLSPTAAGQGRLVVRHTAAAPAVDVLAGGSPVFTGLTNPNEDSADLPAQTYSASVALAGTTDPVIGPADVPVADGQATIVYAIGSAEAGNLGVVVQTIGGLMSAPTGGVPSGSGGLADTDGAGVSAWAIAAFVLGVGGIAFAAPRLATVRRRG
jgi:hypothetical protein